jgi:hypothetical protein
MLWNFLQSHDSSALSAMQKFILNAPWSNLGETDGPVTDSTSTFLVSESGFMFNFATQTVTQPSASFVNNGAPSSAQTAQVGSTALAALDRMYSYAIGNVHSMYNEVYALTTILSIIKSAAASHGRLLAGNIGSKA